MSILKSKSLIRICKAAMAVVFACLILIFSTAAYFLISGELRQSVDRKQAMPEHGRFLKVQGADVFLQELGPENGPVLLFVHATIAWSGTWMPTMQWFANRGYHCFAVDMPPMGFSSPSEQGYSRVVQGQILAELLEDLNLENVTLIGHSAGARSTLTAAALARNRIKQLVIASGALGWSNPSGPEEIQNQFWMRKILGLQIVERIVGSIVTHPSLTRSGLEMFTAEGNRISDEMLKVYQEPFYLKGKSLSVGAWMKEFLTSDDLGLANDTTEIFPKLNFKTLLIWGKQDSTTPVWQGERLAKRLPDAKLVLLDGTGHLPQIEKPEEFRKIIFRFLENTVY